jgi:hypothetical protein
MQNDNLKHDTPTDANNVLAAVFGGIWEGFKTLLAWIFIIYTVLFIVVGGEFSISVKWENIVELWRVLNGS